MPPFHLGALWPARRHCRRADTDPHTLRSRGWGHHWDGGHSGQRSIFPEEEKLWGQEGPHHFCPFWGAFEQGPLGVWSGFLEMRKDLSLGKKVASWGQR